MQAPGRSRHNGRVPYYLAALGDTDPSRLRVLPTGLSPTQKSSAIHVVDGTTAVYREGVAEASVIANYPIPVQCGIYYFEVTVLYVEGAVAIGVTTPQSRHDKLPGGVRRSFAYRSDGKKYSAIPVGQPFSDPYGDGDVVGCLVNLLMNTITFTKNGALLSQCPAFTDLIESRHLFYPVVGMCRRGHCVVNFGNNPFHFDFARHVRSVCHHIITTSMLLRVEDNHSSRCPAEEPHPVSPGEARPVTDGGQEEIDTAGEPEDTDPSMIEDSLPPESLITPFDGMLPTVLLRYLLEEGFPDTAVALATRKGFTLDQGDLELARSRKLVLEAVHSGDAPTALERLQASHPRMGRERPELLFRLRCQHFVETVRTGGLDAALEYGLSLDAFYGSSSSGEETEPTPLPSAEDLQGPSGVAPVVEEGTEVEVAPPPAEEAEEVMEDIPEGNLPGEGAAPLQEETAQSFARLEETSSPMVEDEGEDPTIGGGVGDDDEGDEVDSSSGNRNLAPGHLAWQVVDWDLQEDEGEERCESPASGPPSPRSALTLLPPDGCTFGALGGSWRCGDALERLFSLIGYPDPMDSPHGYLLHDKTRADLAQAINKYMLRADTGQCRGSLDGLIQHTRVMIDALQHSVVGLHLENQFNIPLGYNRV